MLVKQQGNGSNISFKNPSYYMTSIRDLCNNLIPNPANHASQTDNEKDKE